MFVGFRGVDLTTFAIAKVPLLYQRDMPQVGDYPGGPLGAADHRFTIALIARNAYALVTHPTRLFQAEQCFPAANALALGESGITLGLIGAPAYLWNHDPVATYNFVILVLPLIAAFSMYLLVWEWTGVPAAGIVAALLYAFHTLKVGDVYHPYGYDTAWTVLAFLFARRVFAHHRWRDTVGLALACSLQIGGSPYALIAAVLVGIPLLFWFIIRHGLRKLPLAQLLSAAVVVGIVAIVIFDPYLQWQRAGGIQARRVLYFLPWHFFLPGDQGFFGWIMLGLCVIALVTRRYSGRAPGHPHWALLTGALLTVAIAGGGTSKPYAEFLQDLQRDQPTFPAFPNPYPFLAMIVPGLNAIRAPGAVFTGAHLALCILAGFGAAALVRVVPGRYATAMALTLIAAAYVETLTPHWFGQPRSMFVMAPVRPTQEALDFFHQLERLGNSGPILDAPVNELDFERESSAVLLSAYHHRRTGACYNSFQPPVYERVRQLRAQVPDVGALRALRELGFTTIVWHRPRTPDELLLDERIEALAATGPGAPITRILGGQSLTAYAIN